MKELTGWEKKHLRALAHHLKPIIQVGKFGVTDKVMSALDKALDDHELIKIKFMDFKDEKEQLSVKIAESCKAVIAGIIGNMLILYRQNADKEKRKVFIPKK
jgi:RNA-binding protein